MATAGKPVTVGIVGLGRIGWSHHAKTLAKRPEYRIVACVDPLADRRNEAAAELGCATFADFESFLRDSDAEVAVICTRSNDHCRHTVAALGAGKHVVVEKPMAMSVREADRMIAAAAKARRVLAVHQNRRYGENVRFIREVMDSGILGNVFWIRYSGQSFVRRNDWQQLKKFGGGYLNNNGAHSVDFAIQLLDSPVADVWGDLKHTVTAGDADDFLKVILRGRNGRLIEVEQSYACAIAPPRWLVAGTCGTLSSVDEKTATIRHFDPKAVKPIKINPGVPEGRRYGNDDKLPWQEKQIPFEPKGAEPDFYANLFKAVRRKGKLLITPESVREQIRVMDAVRKCAGWKM
ncbi:MAG: Inositol 2-dehydrogenase/D-chiro-inositol 3-dehydrogenase [Phycisphaerae bacterium]|nr:Inositol 2-dehydrogenase/D-chiro-inositol 3-dehydrogenase [Phycisphaerae bacterium]